MIALCRRFFSLDLPDRLLVLEAASLMAFVWIGLRLIRFLTLRRILDHLTALRSTGKAGQASPIAIGAVRWAIGAVAAHVPWTCLVQALAANAMLRRRHQASEVCFGVRLGRNSAVPIQGHAWVECDGVIAVGDIGNLSDFKVLTPARLP